MAAYMELHAQTKFFMRHSTVYVCMYAKLHAYIHIHIDKWVGLCVGYSAKYSITCLFVGAFYAVTKESLAFFHIFVYVYIDMFACVYICIRIKANLYRKKNCTRFPF